MRAVKNSGMVLMFVPEEYYDEELLLSAVSSDSKALEQIPAKYRTPQILERAKEKAAKEKKGRLREAGLYAGN